ncbi:MFS transporter [Pseudomonas sp. LAMO17WK12:I8]|uniref:MFS transporter n=1 Tax=unclassified Pseudomonas TaxID=196821 RepID=UPI003531A18F
MDRYGAKRIGGFGILVWSAASALTGAATNFASLLAARLVMGAGESVSNPVGAKVIREWIPSQERGTITAVSTAARTPGCWVALVLRDCRRHRFCLAVGLVSFLRQARRCEVAEQPRA